MNIEFKPTKGASSDNDNSVNIYLTAIDRYEITEEYNELISLLYDYHTAIIHNNEVSKLSDKQRNFTNVMPIIEPHFVICKFEKLLNFFEKIIIKNRISSDIFIGYTGMDMINEIRKNVDIRLKDIKEK